MSVAEAVHFTMTCCHAEGPCALFDGVQFDSEAARDFAGSVRECRRCPRFRDTLPARLAGLRLGKVERRVLLSAGSRKPLVLPSTSNAEAKATYRAIGKLESAWLVERDRVQTTAEGKTPTEMARAETWPRFTAKVCVELTPLGHLVMGQFRDAIGGGGRVRWASLDWSAFPVENIAGLRAKVPDALDREREYITENWRLRANLRAGGPAAQAAFRRDVATIFSAIQAVAVAYADESTKC